MADLKTQKQEVFDYVYAMLGGGMVDVELDPVHYETGLTKALTRYRQRSDGSVVFEGATADAFETTLAITDPTADRTITFPDLTGTVALTSGVINNSLLTTTGDTIYASGTSTPARLAIGSAGQTLTVSAGGIPEWATPAAGTTANDQAFAFAVQVFA